MDDEQDKEAIIDLLDQRWTALVCAATVMAFSGAFYFFPTYSVALSTTMHLSNEQLQTVGTFSNFGGYLSIVGGFVLDGRNGIVWCGRGGVVLTALGFSILGLVVGHGLPMPSALLSQQQQEGSMQQPRFAFADTLVLSLGAFLSTQGCAWAYIWCIKSQLRLFPSTERGEVMGILVCFFALSSGIVSQTFRTFFETASSDAARGGVGGFHRLHYFFFMLATVIPCVQFLALRVVTRVLDRYQEREEAEQKEEEQLARLLPPLLPKTTYGTMTNEQSDKSPETTRIGRGRNRRKEVGSQNLSVEKKRMHLLRWHAVLLSLVIFSASVTSHQLTPTAAAATTSTTPGSSSSSSSSSSFAPQLLFPWVATMATVLGLVWMVPYLLRSWYPLAIAGGASREADESSLTLRMDQSSSEQKEGPVARRKPPPLSPTPICSSTQDQQLQERGANISNLAEIVNAVSHVEFWLLFGSFMMALGYTVTFFNNASILLASLTSNVPRGSRFASFDELAKHQEENQHHHGSTTAAATFSLVPLQELSGLAVLLFTAFNAWSRLFFGALADYFFIRFRTHRSVWLLACTLVMLVSSFTVVFALRQLSSTETGTVNSHHANSSNNFRSSPTFLVLAALCITAVGMGGVASAVPLITAEVFGLWRFGKLWGLLGIAPVFSTFLLSTKVAGGLADAYSNDGHFFVVDKRRFCLGAPCFEETFVILVATNSIAVLCAAWLAWRLRNG